ncbi:hypothetical protein ES703_119027 [subsurface metagenome]
MLMAVINWAWCPVIITALAVVAFIYGWPIEAVVPSLVVIFGIGLVLAIIRAKKNELELLSTKLRQLAGYFNRRFMGNSSLSIFAIIDSLYSIDNPQVWDWARACGISQRIFDTWGNSFISRLESDFRTRKLSYYLQTYLNELWSINSHYHEFIEQFYEVAEKFKTPQEIIDQYNRFVLEYNAFAQSFRDAITELKTAARTEIEPPSVKFAREMPRAKRDTGQGDEKTP